MSTDTRTRALERDMDPEAAGALLRERIRAGEVLERHVRLAAWLGYPPALAAAEPYSQAEWSLDDWNTVNKAGKRVGSWRAGAEVLCWGPPS